MKRIVGAYALEGENQQQRLELIQKIMGLGLCTGLEIPIFSNLYKEDASWLWSELGANTSNVFTMITATMEAIEENENFGLASQNDEGRDLSLKMLASVRDIVAKLNREHNQRIFAVEIQSAPQMKSEPETREAFTESLLEIASWDWSGAAICVEHCDAFTTQHTPAKGFLTLDDEVSAVLKAREAQSRTPVGITLNWGRSAIELRDGAAVNDHISHCREANVLYGLMYSSASPVANAFGPAWTDAHLPLRPNTDLDPGEPTSALTSQLLQESRMLAGDELLYDGIKTSIRPLDSPVEAKTALVKYGLRQLNNVYKLPAYEATITD